MEEESTTVITPDQPVTMGQLLQLFKQLNPSNSPTENTNSNPTSTNSNLTNTPILSEKLNSHNYTKWSRLMHLAINGRDRLSHIIADPPSKDDLTYSQWTRNDAIVISWILENIDSDLVNQYLDYPTAKTLWRGIETLYSSGRDGLQIFDLTVKTNNLKQGEDSIETYYGKLFQLWQEIDRRQPNPMRDPEDMVIWNKIIPTDECDPSFLIGARIDIGWSERLIPAKKGWARSLVNGLEKDPDFIYTTDAAGETVFHVLARAGDATTILKIFGFIEKRQLYRILRKQNINGDTALHLALKNRHPTTAYWLDKADVWSGVVKNKDGVHPRDLAYLAGYDIHMVLSKSDITILQSGFSDFEMRLAWENIIVEPEVKVKWIRQIPKGSREDFLKACYEFIKPKQIQKELDESGGNLLHIAARLGSVKLLSLLVPCKSSSELTSLAFEKDLKDCTPLHLAIKNEHKAAAMHLIQVAPATAYWDRKGGSPLYLAIKSGYLDLVLQIFHHLPGTDIDSSTRKQIIEAKTSIVYAAIGARSQSSSTNDMLRTIMKELPGCIDSINKKGWSPLSYAAFKGYSDEVSYFLNNFPDSALKPDIDGSFPIHKAVCAGHLEIIKQFLSLCPMAMDVIDIETEGSILHFAVRYRKKEVFSYLIRKKNVMKILNLKDRQGKTIMDLAYDLFKST